MSPLKNHQNLWTRLIGYPLPSPEQFVWWATHFFDEIIKYAIQRTAVKNLAMNGTMTQLYRERYATKVMRSRLKDLQRVQKMRAACAEQASVDFKLRNEVM